MKIILFLVLLCLLAPSMTLADGLPDVRNADYAALLGFILAVSLIIVYGIIVVKVYAFGDEKLSKKVDGEGLFWSFIILMGCAAALITKGQFW